MVLVSMIFSLCLAAIVWVSYYIKNNAALAATFLISGIFLFVTLLGFVIPSTTGMWLILAVLSIVASNLSLRPKWFAVWCAVAPVLMFGSMALLYIPVYHEHQQMLVKYPVVDLGPRLAYESEFDANRKGRATPGKSDSDIQLAVQNAGQTGAPNDEALKDLESKVEYSTYYRGMMYQREAALQAMGRIHVSFVHDFVDQPGFGRSRIPTMTVLRERHVKPPEFEPVPQPTAPPPPPAATPDSPSAEIPQGGVAQRVPQNPPAIQANAGRENSAILEGVIPLPEFNAQQIASFASVDSYGLVIDKRRARGFLSHRFRRLPDEVATSDAAVRWKLERLQLVSLLRHQPGAAYISENLPAMDELVDAQTRRLDTFEDRAIRRIRQGEDIVLESEDLNHKRMVGSIRAAKHCTQCHAVNRGELLGAFTYRFYRTPLLAEPAGPGPDKTISWLETDLSSATASK